MKKTALWAVFFMVSHTSMVWDTYTQCREFYNSDYFYNMSSPMRKILFLLLISPVIVQAQIITTIAGNDTSGYRGDLGPATTAELHVPTCSLADAVGNVYISDYGNNRIRKVNAFGTITTIAGTGSTIHSGDGGPATAAGIAYPYGMTIDSVGNLYFVEDSGYVLFSTGSWIMKIDTAGIISTIGGDGMFGYSGDGGPATGAEFNSATDIAIDIRGNIYVVDLGNNSIRKINTSGIITTIAGDGMPGYSGDGGPAVAAQLYYPFGIAVDRIGNLFISDRGNSRLRKVDTAGYISTIAGTGIGGYSGDGGLATNAELSNPLGMAVDGMGNVYIVDNDNMRIRKIDTMGIITTIVGSGIDGDGGDGGFATDCELNNPSSVAIDNTGDIYVTDIGNNNVRKVCAKCSGLSVPNISKENEITIFPNPATTQLTIQSTAQPITHISITNLLDQTVFNLQFTVGSLQASVDVSALPAGMYFVRINDSPSASSGQAVVRKFLKE